MWITSALPIIVQLVPIEREETVQNYS